jgi:hypothetical protein
MQMLVVNAEIMEPAALVSVTTSEDDHFNPDRPANSARALFPWTVSQSPFHSITAQFNSLILHHGGLSIPEDQELGVIHDGIEGLVYGFSPLIELPQRIERGSLSPL